MKSESVLVSRAARNWRPPVRRSRRHRPPPFGLPCRTRPFLRGPLLPGQPRFPFPAVACFPAPKGLRLAELGTYGERPPGEACGTLGRGPCSRPFPVCVRLEYFNRKNMARKIFSKENDGAQKKSRLMKKGGTFVFISEPHNSLMGQNKMGQMHYFHFDGQD